MARIFRVLLVAMSSALSFAASTNDFFSSRVVLSGALSNLTTSASFVGSSREPGEPHNFTGSLWWEWTPALEGGMVLRTFASPDYPAPIVYTGTWPNLTRVSAPVPGQIYPMNKSSFYAHSNVTYYIAAAAPSNSITGNVTLYLNPTAAADDFSRAVPVEGTNVSSFISSNGATLQPGEIPSGTNVVGTLWWKWSVTNSARYVVNVSLQSIPLNVAIYTGDALTNLTRIAFAPPSRADSFAFLGARAVLSLDPGTYYIAAEDLGYQQSASLSIRLAPANDLFADRFVLPSTNFITTFGSFFGATLEPNEPGRTNASLWWEWTAPATGSYSIDTVAPAGSPAVEIFQGDSLTNLTLIAPLAAPASSHVASIRARAGETFVIRLSDPYPAAGNITLRIRPGPANDDFQNATIVQGAPFGTNISVMGATFEPNEPRPPLVGGLGTVWFTWIPTNSGSYSVNATISGAYSPLYAYRGDSLTNLVPVTNAYTLPPNVINAGPSTFRVEAGEAIHLQLIQQSSGSAAALSIRAAMENDAFANAILITNELTSSTTRGASTEPGEPLGGARGQTLWYRWQPELHGHEIQLNHTTGEGNVLSLYEGTALTNLVLRRRIQAFSGQLATDTYLPEPSRTYYIAIDAQTPGGDTFSFRITPGPTNDTFASRAPILLNETFVVSTFGATREPGEPAHNNINSPRTLWYEWTAPETAGYYLDVSTTLAPPALAVYEGTNITALTSVPAYDLLTPSAGGMVRFVTFRAIAGRSYAIVIYDNQSQIVQVTLRKAVQNDDFANATDIALGAQVSGPSHGATIEPGELATNVATGTVWHAFTAPTNGSYVAVCNRDISVFRGTALSNLVEAAPRRILSSPAIQPFRAAAGETVFISVTASSPHSYSLRLEPGAANDDFAFRLTLTNEIVVLHPAWSTLEPGEPSYAPDLVSSIWFSWTPTNTAIHRIVASGIHHRAFLAAYLGTNLADLELISSITNEFSQETIIDLHALAGAEYALLYNHVPSGDNPLSLVVYTAPAHDNFASPQPILLNQTVTNRFAVATKEPGETNVAPETVWYTWTAPATDTFVFVPRVQDGYWGTVNIYTGDALTNLTPVASLQNITFSDGLPFRAVEGMTYRIVLGFGQSAYERTVEATIVPGNPHDDFAERAQLSGLFVAWTNTTFGATLEPGENALHLSSLQNSVWAEWIAPASGTFKITPLPFISYTPRFSVYRGDSLSSLQLAHPTNGNSATTFVAEQGATYQIRAASSLQMPQGFTMRLGPIATNESPATATRLEGTNIVIVAQNWTTTAPTFPSPSQPAPAIWYSWTAPAHGFLTYHSRSNSAYIRSSIAAYHTRQPTLDSNLTTITGVRLSDSPFLDPGTIWLPRLPVYTNTTVVTEGVTYLFALSPPPSTNVHFALSFEPDEISLAGLTNVLLGGDDFWFAQTNVFYSGSDALQAGPLTNNQLAWAEMIFTGSGTLRFRTKIDGSGGAITVLTSARPPLIDSPQLNQPPISGTHDWTLRSRTLSGRTNVVRLSFHNSSSLKQPVPSTAWIDDIEFIPRSPAQPHLSLLRNTAGAIFVTVQVEANQPTSVDFSTNLIEWVPWTNLIYTVSGRRNVPLPPADEATPFIFFRARVPTNAPAILDLSEPW